jgi:ATP phosphoribosyltransferase regulatory subunit
LLLQCISTEKVINRMNKYSKITPEGTRDLLFEECDARRNVECELSAMFKARSYKKVITPTLEFFDVFNRESSGIEPESLYTLTDYAGRMMVLRPDSTLPIARIAATRLKDAEYPLRLYYNQRVFHRFRSFSGHSDETTQSGIELIGASGIRADLEIITTAIDALNYCGAPDFRIEIGHAGFFKALSKALKTTDEVRANIVAYIEAKNFAALNDLLDTLGDSDATRVLRSLPRLFGDIEVIEKAESMCRGKDETAPLKYLAKLYAKLMQLGLGDKINIDLGLVHRNNYYSGVVFRGFIEGSGLTVLSGGRYDMLIGEFGKPLPATGFGVEIDALAGAMLNRGATAPKMPADVLVFGEDGYEIQALVHIRQLNSEDLVCENCLALTLDEARAYAAEKGIKQLDCVDANGCRTIRLP